MLRLIARLSITVGLLLTALQAEARQPDYPDSTSEMMEVIRSNYHLKRPPFRRLSKLKGRIVNLNVNWFYSGQSTYSSLKIMEKLIDAVDDKDVIWNKDSEQWDLAHYKGQAVYGPDHSGLAIVLRDCVLLLDGNHKWFTSLYYGANFFPVRIFDVMNKTLDEAFPELVEKRLVFPYGTKGRRLQGLPTMEDMIDEPYRYLAEALLLKCDVEPKGKKGGFEIGRTRGFNQPLACKLNRDTTYLELLLAIAMRLGGLEYEPELGKTPPQKILRQIRKILLDAQDSSWQIFRPLHDTLILEEPWEVRRPKNLNKREMKYLLDLVEDNLDDPERCELILGNRYF